MRPRITILVISILTVIGLVGLLFFVYQRESLITDGQVSLPSLQHSAQVRFDNLSVPYIEARSEKDMTMAQGYITAAERLFQMDMLRRIAKGQMAVVFGSNCLAGDRLAHTLGFKRIAEAEYKILSLETKTWLKSYCQGVNTYIAQNNKKLPLEFILLGYEPEPWQPADTLAILKYLQYSSDECWQLNILQASVTKRAGAQLAYQMFDYSLPTSPPGGNGLVISGKLSQSRGSLLACDRHTLFTFPNLFFACSLRAPLIHTAGITIPGVPGILIGRNDHISWAALNLKAHTQDLYVQEFSDEFPNQSKGTQGWLNTQEFQEEIGQKFAANVVERIIITKDGPLLTRDGQKGVALSWYGFNPTNNMIESICPINKAKNWTEFQTALQKYRGSPQTFLYADTAGNIAKQIAGHTAQTVEQSDNTSAFIVANEGEPATSRIKSLLKMRQSTGKTFAFGDIAALQADTKAPLSELVTSTIQHTLSSTGNTDKYQQDATAMLSNWDGQLKANSSSACLYEAFLTSFTKAILQAKIGEKLTDDYMNNYPYWSKFTRQVLEQQPTELLPPANYSFEIFTSNCFAQALNNLRLAFHIQPIPGSLKRCQWQYLHQIDFRSNMAKILPVNCINMVNSFLPGNIGIGGDQDCVNACNYQISNHSSLYTCHSGPSTRLLIDMADNNKFYQSLTFGQSGHLFSGDRIDNTKNQIKSWCNVEFHALGFSPSEINLLARHNLILSNDI